ncbi:hypothetical protein HYY72_01895 [Candidatus Woesearchaeota archaeon]|nr:hypothetical protein [Candidatus Woesearchaeota archaeon]
MPDEIEEIKRKKLEALQRQYQEGIHQQAAEEQEAQQQIAALEAAVKSRLSKEALQRYGNIKAAHPEKAVQLLIVLGRLIQLGRVNMISDENLKAVLQKMDAEKRETRITRR